MEISDCWSESSITERCVKFLINISYEVQCLGEYSSQTDDSFNKCVYSDFYNQLTFFSDYTVLWFKLGDTKTDKQTELNQSKLIVPVIAVSHTVKCGFVVSDKISMSSIYTFSNEWSSSEQKRILRAASSANTHTPLTRCAGVKETCGTPKCTIVWELSDKKHSWNPVLTNHKLQKGCSLQLAL